MIQLLPQICYDSYEEYLWINPKLNIRNKAEQWSKQEYYHTYQYISGLLHGRVIACPNGICYFSHQCRCDEAGTRSLHPRLKSGVIVILSLRDRVVRCLKSYQL